MAAKSTVAEGWLVGPRFLRTLAIVVGLAGLALPALVVKWVTATTPPPEGLGVGPLRPEMVVVPKGLYTIGSPESEDGHIGNEQQHRVELRRPFAIAVTEVTQEQYERVMGENPSTDRSCGGDCPVTDVSWLDAVKYLNALAERDSAVHKPCYRIDGEDVEWLEGCTGYRLPTEAEWEVAARAETSVAYAGTGDPAEVCRYGNVTDATFKSANPDWQFGVFECDDGYEGLAPVARFRPNSFRLFDMTGNVREWVRDWYLDYEGDARDLQGPPSGQARVYRGGSFGGNPLFARVAYRGLGGPSSRLSDLGFRVARPLP